MAIYRNFNQEQLDAQYNVRAGIPNYLEIFARWKSDGAAFRSAHVVQENLAYGEDEKQQLDFFPATYPDQPLLIFIHGGYWQSLDKSDFSSIAGPYLEKNINVAVVNYRLAPSATMSEIVSDNQKALTWLFDNASRLNFSRDRIFVSGHSAGGHLTAVLAGTDWKALGYPADLIKGGCAISGLYDLEPIRLCYLNKVVGLTAHDVAVFSPLRTPRPFKVPMILTVGGAESPEYFRLQAEYEQLLKQEGSLLRVVDLKTGHHFDAVDALGVGSGELSQTVVRMICSS